MSLVDPLDTGWHPPRAAELAGPPAVAVRTGPGGGTVALRRRGFSCSALAGLATLLAEQARTRLRRRPVASIVAALDQVAQLWLDPATPERRLAVDSIARLSGFSTATVAHALDLEFESSRGPHLERALRSELGSAEVLDDFVSDEHLGGRHRAVGPLLVGGFASANIPGLPHLIATRAWLVKSACWIRCSRDEPIFLPLFARTVARVDADLAAAFAVVDFDPEDDALVATFLERSDHVVAYGGADALASVARRLPPGKPATWHGHRLGFGAICRESLGADVRPLAERVAYDFSLFDREACLSPQALFVEEGGAISARAFAAQVADAMRSWAERLPPALLALGDRARWRQTLDTLALRAAAGEPVEVIADAPGYAVVLDETSALAPAPRGRFVRIVPLASLDALRTRIEPARVHLQVACLDGPDERRDVLARDLAELGVTRITRSGLAGLPSMMWRHDGVACLAHLVRWVGEELVSPSDRC